MNSIIRTKKHKSTSSLKSRMTHTYRTRPTPNADPKKLQKNKLLVGTEDYATALETKLKDYENAGNHIRSDAVLAIEYLLTASPEFFDIPGKLDRDRRLQEWCDKQVAFMKEKHGAENILCMYLHLDEKTPHIECFVMPIDNKGKLNCKYYLGGSKKLSLLQTEYASYNKIFGLTRGREGSNAEHTTVKQFYADIQQADKVTVNEVKNAIKLDKPTMFDILNPTEYISKQEERVSRHVINVIKPMAAQSKLIRNVKILQKEADKLRTELEKTKQKHSEESELIKAGLLGQAKLLEIIEFKTEEIANLTADNERLRLQVEKFHQIQKSKLSNV